MLPSLPVLLTESEDGDLDSLKDENVTKSKTKQEQRGGKRKFKEISDQKDNEDDITALMKASTTIKATKSLKGKKPPQIRHLEKTLNCLLADNEELQDEKSFAFAQAYFLKVTEKLVGKNDATYQDFLKTLNEFGLTVFSVPELYQKISKILSNYPELTEEFLAFLLPEQAMACGKFMDFLMVTKMKGFCRKLELYYAKQPMQLRKIFSSLSTLAANRNATVKDVRDALIPLLKSNSFLLNMLLDLMPPNAPHQSFFTHFESMDFPEAGKPLELFETVAIPPPVEDNYGGPQCVCSCHPSESKEGKDLKDINDSNGSKCPKERRNDTHCVSCGAKFIQGRIFFQSGKMLHPAKVSFREMGAAERLSARVIRSCQQNRLSGNKKGGALKNDMTEKGVSSSGAGGKGRSPKRAKGKATKATKAMEQTRKKAPRKTLANTKPANKKAQKKDVKQASGRKEAAKLRSGVGRGGGKEAYMQVALKPSEQLAISPRAARWSGRNNALRRAEAHARETSTPPVEPLVVAGDASSVVRNSRGKGDVDVTVVESETSPALGGKKEARDDSGCVEQDVGNKGGDGADHSSTTVVEEERTTNAAKEEEEDNGDKLHAVDEEETENVAEEEEDSVHMIDEEETENIVEEEEEEDSDNVVDEEDPENVTVAEDTENTADEEDTENMIDEEYTENVLDEEDGEVLEGEEDAENVGDEEDPETMMDEEEPGDAMDEDSENVMDEDSVNTEEEEDCVSVVEMKDSAEDVYGSAPISLKNDINISDDSSVEYQDEGMGENTGSLFPGCEGESEVSEEGKRESVSEDETGALNDSDASAGTEVDGDCSEEEMEESSIVPPKDYAREDQEESTSMCWTRDEDKVILQTFQTEPMAEHVFQKICELLPHRTLEEVQSRFETLMSFLKDMVGD